MVVKCDTPGAIEMSPVGSNGMVPVPGNAWPVHPPAMHARPPVHGLSQRPQCSSSRETSVSQPSSIMSLQSS
jgi:hypothetical protein